MLSMPVISYLFLGGIGAGSLVVLIGMDCWIKRREYVFRGRENVSRVFMWPLRRLVSQGYLISLVVLVLGIVCLLVDLGRAENALLMFMRPFSSIISIGSYALSILVVLAAFLAVSNNMDLPRMPRALLFAVKVFTVIVALFVMIYTGLYLRGVRAVPLWGSALVPLLFFLSSLSCGIALVLGAAFLVEKNVVTEKALGLLVKIDAVLIVAESLALVSFLLQAAFDAPELAFRESSFVFVGSDEVRFAFWVGLVLCGLVLPLLIELAVFRKDMHVVGAFLAVLVLVGGFSLRFCVVEAGAFPSMLASAAASEQGVALGSASATTSADLSLAGGR